MRNTIVHSAMAAIVLMASLLASEASAGVESVHHRFVQNQFEDYPVMELKFQKGRWNWINSSKTFMPRVELHFTSTTTVDDARLYVDEGAFALWTRPVGKQTKTYEKIITVSIGKTVLSRQLKRARSVCESFGGPEKTVRDLAVDTTFTATGMDRNGAGDDTLASYQPLVMKVVCHSVGANDDRESFSRSVFRFLVTKARF